MPPTRPATRVVGEMVMEEEEAEEEEVEEGVVVERERNGVAGVRCDMVREREGGGGSKGMRQQRGTPVSGRRHREGECEEGSAV